MLLADNRSLSSVKIADFGLARSSISRDKNTMSTICGTPTYVAPEVITGQAYGRAVDMWSAGVILYILLSGSVPFDDESEIKLFKKIARGDYDLSYEEWQAISEEAKDLIRGLMCVDPKKRLTADQALAHPWWALEELQGTVLQMTKLRTYVERLKMPIRRFKQGEMLVRQARTLAPPRLRGAEPRAQRRAL